MFPTQEDQTTRQQGPPRLIGADRGLQPLIRVHLITCGAVTVLWHPLVGPLKGVGKSKCAFVWLPIEHLLLRSVGPDFQHKAGRSVVQHSCPELLLGKQLLRMSPFP